MVYEETTASVKSFAVRPYQGRNYWQVKSLKADSIEADEEFGFVVGWISGDGHIRKNRDGVTLLFSKTEKGIWEKIESSLKKWGVVYSSPRQRAGCFDVEAGGYQFRSILDQIFVGTTAKDKVFSLAVFSTPQSFKRGLLRGLFSSDGTRKVWEED